MSQNAVHGSTCTFSLDNAGGTPVDLTGHTPEVNPEMLQAMHDTTVFGDTAHEKFLGLKDGKFSLTILANPRNI